MWKLHQYGTAYDEIYEQCDTRLKAHIDARLNKLRSEGNQARASISKPIEDGIFELRARSGNVQVRFLYFFRPKKIIIVAVGLFKTQRKIPRADIEKAKKIKLTFDNEPELLDDTTEIH